MASRILKFTAAGSLNLQPVGPNERVTITGFEIYNTAAAARFVKLYFGNSTFGGSGSGFSGGADKPTVGTDLPQVTIGLGATSRVGMAYMSPVTHQGTCFVATTVNAADSDSTAVTAGDLIVSIFYE